MVSLPPFRLRVIWLPPGVVVVQTTGDGPLRGYVVTNRYVPPGPSPVNVPESVQDVFVPSKAHDPTVALSWPFPLAFGTQSGGLNVLTTQRQDDCTAPAGLDEATRKGSAAEIATRMPFRPFQSFWCTQVMRPFDISSLHSSAAGLSLSKVCLRRLALQGEPGLAKAGRPNVTDCQRLGPHDQVATEDAATSAPKLLRDQGRQQNSAWRTNGGLTPVLFPCRRTISTLFFLTTDPESLILSGLDRRRLTGQLIAGG